MYNNVGSIIIWKQNLGINTRTNQIQSAKMKLLRSVKSCSILNKIKNKEVRKELEIESIIYIIDYKWPFIIIN